MPRKTFVVLVILIVPLLAGFWTGYRVGHQTSTTQRTSPAAGFTEAAYSPSSDDTVSDQISSQRRNAITRAVAAASPAVVGINVTEIREYRVQDPFSQFLGNDPFFRQFFGERIYQQPVKSLGSGFIV